MKINPFGANSGHYQDSRRCIHAFNTKKKEKDVIIMQMDYEQLRY